MAPAEPPEPFGEMLSDGSQQRPRELRNAVCPDPLSINGRLRLHPREKLYVSPIMWTARQLQILDCRFVIDTSAATAVEDKLAEKNRAVKIREKGQNDRQQEDQSVRRADDFQKVITSKPQPTLRETSFRILDLLNKLRDCYDLNSKLACLQDFMVDYGFTRLPYVFLFSSSSLSPSMALLPAFPFHTYVPANDPGPRPTEPLERSQVSISVGNASRA